MSKAVMISIKPTWVELIASGRKTVEVRKTRPKIDTPFKCYIYCTKSDGWYGVQSKANPAKKTNATGKVVGEFVCDWIGDGIFTANWSGFSSFPIYDGTCLNLDDYMAYVGGDKKFFGWHISNLKMYGKPKELSEFYHYAKDCKSDRCDTCWYHDYSIKDEPCNSCRLDVLDRVYLWRPPQSWGYVEELEE